MFVRHSCDDKGRNIDSPLPRPHQAKPAALTPVPITIIWGGFNTNEVPDPELLGEMADSWLGREAVE